VTIAHSLRAACVSVALALVLAGGSAGARAAEEIFRIGIAPHTSPRVIVEQYQPVRAAIEQAVGGPAEVITAPDFTEFARRALAGQYDLVITTAHQAELLRADAGYLPLVTYSADFRAVVVVSATFPWHGPKSLDATTVIGLNPSSLVTLWDQHWLKSNGVVVRETRYVSAADSMAQLLLTGEGAAGFMSLANVQKLAPDVQAQLRVVAQSPAIPGRVYMLSPASAPRLDAIRATLAAFAQSPAGQRYFAENKLDGYRPIHAAELKTMESFADEVRAILRDAPR